MLVGGFLLTFEEACRFLQRDLDSPRARRSTVALDIEAALKPANLMIELITWPKFSYSNKPEDTCYILPTRAANFSSLQFSIIGWDYKRLPQFTSRDREQGVLKKLRELGLEMKDPQFITVFKHDECLAQVRPVPNWIQAPWPPPYNVAAKKKKRR